MTDGAPAMASRAIVLCGTEASDPPPRRLKAGPLEADLENGQLRYVTYAGIEVLRGVAFLVRDENWGTYSPAIQDLQIDEASNRFGVRYKATCGDAKQRLSYEAHIVGSSDGSLSFAAVATPETDVITNRTGFVVLHPAGLAGRVVRVTHVDGREVETCFPEFISPSQPIFDIRALAHEVAPNLWATCHMKGDAFEMEDQRNWGDASYKTYVRPLARPWGYKLEKGSRHEQEVRLSIEGPVPVKPRAQAADLVITIGGDLTVKMPAVGVGVPAAEAAATLDRVESLRRLHPRFLVCSIDSRELGSLAQVRTYCEIAKGTSASVVLEIVIPDDRDALASLAPVAQAVQTAELELEAVIISSAADLKSWQPGAARPEKPAVEEIARAARAAFPGVQLGGGMLSTFTELNRKRPKPELVDYVSHTTCSIVHAADDRSVMETLETLPAILASTRAMIGEKPYWIGPSAIGARDNPYGKSAAGNPGNGRICLSNRDPRQRGLFNAAWLLGYIALCAYGGVERVAMGAATGTFGVIWRPGDDAEPCFDSIGGSLVYPAFHVLAGLSVGFGRQLVEVKLSENERAATLAWRQDGRLVLWIANLTAEPLSLTIMGLAPAPRRISILDAVGFDVAIRDPSAFDRLSRVFAGGRLTLDAYAVARIS